MSLEDLKRLGPKLFPACLNCNSILGNSWELLLVDRRDLIAWHLEKKHTRMLSRGKFLYERQIPIHGDFREIACLRIYERWLFASITLNEATPEPEPEEVYRRDNFAKGIDRAKLTEPLWLTSWGLPDDVGEHELSMELKQTLELALRFSDTRGPVGWPSTPTKYLETVRKDLGTEVAEKFIEALSKRGGALSYLVRQGCPEHVEAPEKQRPEVTSLPAIQRSPQDTNSAKLQSTSTSLNNNSGERRMRSISVTHLDLYAASELLVHRPKFQLNDFTSLRSDEIHLSLRHLKALPIPQARDQSLPMIKVFLKSNIHAHLRSGDGSSFFKAVALSQNCPPTIKEEILRILAQREA